MTPPRPATSTLAARVRALLDRRDPVLRLLGEGRDLARVVAELETSAEHSFWRMADRHVPSIARVMREVPRPPRLRALQERVVFSATHAHESPLLTSFEPGCLVGPVHQRLTLVDGRCLVVPGQDGAAVVGSAYGTDDPALVALAHAAFEEAWVTAVPWREAGLRPPLPLRRFRMALLLLEGHSDQEIADELGVGPRTVSREVREVVAWLGARNRSHAVALLVGAGAP
ncbi:helix-turn-helix transcriptional regulator [Phycicoccus sp. MAQZ13P-2]|uniref:helix-turn-helix transcriptional regulator n=1 Tax=Phycicoccus mangrovi TaxID=2840470 RepID=UPI001C004B0C|nr:helix-turn-helix transcriptional regulator [Phycicoccus mangrovi]MBT9257248.1 helix-turn-helix transcriptional regulator [Phycicoccus mangrovi]MBT9276185.1 helix-turn-helix transcriptional regulator [Phycicoccus mangrovi]